MSQKSIIDKIIDTVSENAPVILSVAAGIGVVVTAVFASKAGAKAERIKADENIDGKEAYKQTIKGYIPAVTATVITIGCIASSAILNKQCQASLATLYIGASEAYKQYRKTNIEVNGEEADTKVIEALQAANLGVHLSGGLAQDDLLPMDGEDILVWTEYTGFFNTTVANLLSAEHHIDRLIVTNEIATLEDFYTFLGIDLPPDSDIENGYDAVDYGMYGWYTDYLLDSWDTFWLDFYHVKRTTDDGLEYYELSTLAEPIDLSDVKDEYIS